MNKHNHSAVIITADARLKRILLTNKSKADKFEISLEDNIISLGAKPKSDAYIYDIELSNDDLSTTIAAITDLKKIISKKPLILIGRESVLTRVLDDKKVQSMVAKTIKKPIASGQLQLAMSSCLQMHTPSQNRPPLQSNSTNQRRLVAALAIAFISVSAFTYLNTERSTPNQIDYSMSVAKPSHDIVLADTNEAKPESQEITQLHKSALLALQDGRLNEPLNDNAIYYLDQIKRIDPYNATTNKLHKQIFTLLETSYSKHSLRGDDQETKKALNIIIELEPYNHKYAKLLRELKERIYLEGKSNIMQTAQKIEVSNFEQTVSVDKI